MTLFFLKVEKTEGLTNILGGTCIVKGKVNIPRTGISISVNEEIYVLLKYRMVREFVFFMLSLADEVSRVTKRMKT